MVKFLKTYCLGDLIDVLIIISRHILMSLTASLFSISEKKIKSNAKKLLLTCLVGLKAKVSFVPLKVIDCKVKSCGCI